MNPFFDELFKHWKVLLRFGLTKIPVEVDDSDDESTDFGNFFAVVKSDPYEVIEPTGASIAEIPSTSKPAKIVIADSPVKVEMKAVPVEVVPDEQPVSMEGCGFKLELNVDATGQKVLDQQILQLRFLGPFHSEFSRPKPASFF